MVTIFENYSTPVDNKELNTILDEIKNGKFINEVNAVRQLYKAGNKTEGDLKKKKLQGFTPSATFNTVRKAHLAENYTHFIILDLDKLTESELKRVSNLATLAPYTYSSFVSPSGNGLKILVRVDTDLEHHATAYNQVAEYYEQALEIDLDRSGKDVSRLCFYSYDPQLFLNTESLIFNVNKEYVLNVEPIIETKEALTSVTKEIISEDALFQNAVDFTNKKSTYSSGNRNNFIHLLACNCNRLGIKVTEAENLIKKHYDLDVKEIEASLRSVYQNNLHEFAKYANLTNHTTKKENDEEEFLKSTPTIPQSVYDTLPAVLKDGSNAFETPRERDTFLTGALAILSGCLPKVTGVYGQRTVYPHLFVFILAPAASGKGALQSSKALADKYHERTKNASVKAQKEYEVEMREYKKRHSGKKSLAPSDEEPPVEPPFQVVFIPANTSNAKIYTHLGCNNGGGIICETEADTLGVVFKQDWGSYSDMLRKAFHHERLSVSRKTNNEYIEVDNPRLAVALSGTPKQVFNIIASAEDGLFSRFAFYTFKTESKWRSPSPYDSNINLTEHFASLSMRVLDIIDFLEESPTEVNLTKEQWDRFNPIFEKHLFYINAFVSEDAESVVKRLGLILYRFCMIFTTLRKFENAEDTLKMICSDSDFNNAVALVDVFLQHSILMFNNLPKQEGAVAPVIKNTNKKQLLEALPNEFKRAEAIELAVKYKMKPRTCDLFLSDLVANNYLTQPM
jgi:hypothetical protein